MALNENSTLEEIVDEIDRLNNLIVDRGGERIITPSTVNQVLEKGNYTNKYIKKTVYANQGYKNLPLTSPGFNAD